MWTWVRQICTRSSAFPNPPKSISDFINKRVGTLEETIVSTPLPNLFLISGAMNNLDMANLAHEQKMKVLRGVTKLSYDYILLDLGAGTAFNTIDFFMISNDGHIHHHTRTDIHREHLPPHPIRLFPQDPAGAQDI